MRWGLQVFHEVAYKAHNRDHLIAGLDEFLDLVRPTPSVISSCLNKFYSLVSGWWARTKYHSLVSSGWWCALHRWQCCLRGSGTPPLGSNLQPASPVRCRLLNIDKDDGSILFGEPCLFCIGCFEFSFSFTKDPKPVPSLKVALSLLTCVCFVLVK